jgi:hypothetical protein
MKISVGSIYVFESQKLFMNLYNILTEINESAGP